MPNEIFTEPFQQFIDKKMHEFTNNMSKIPWNEVAQGFMGLKNEFNQAFAPKNFQQNAHKYVTLMQNQNLKKILPTKNFNDETLIKEKNSSSLDSLKLISPTVEKTPYELYKMEYKKLFLPLKLVGSEGKFNNNEGLSMDDNIYIRIEELKTEKEFNALKLSDFSVCNKAIPTYRRVTDSNEIVKIMDLRNIKTSIETNDVLKNALFEMNKNFVEKIQVLKNGALNKVNLAINEETTSRKFSIFETKKLLF